MWLSAIISTHKEQWNCRGNGQHLCIGVYWEEERYFDFMEAEGSLGRRRNVLKSTVWEIYANTQTHCELHVPSPITWLGRSCHGLSRFFPPRPGWAIELPSWDIWIWDRESPFIFSGWSYKIKREARSQPQKRTVVRSGRAPTTFCSRLWWFLRPLLTHPPAPWPAPWSFRRCHRILPIKSCPW